MAEDRLDRIEKILQEVSQISEKIVKEHELFAEEMHKLKESQAKTDEQIKQLRKSQAKTDEQLKKTAKEIDKVNKLVGDLTGGWGKFVVGLVEPSIEECIKDIGFKLLRAQTPPPVRRNGKELEIDVVAVITENNKPYVMVIDVKSYINQQKIDDFIERRLKRFKDFFIDYKDSVVVGAVAGVRYAEGAISKALNEGLYVFKTKKGFMRNATPAEFKPKIY